ncbi:MAG: hypothetical protein AB1458_04245 [Bacteroidota bacterium]
MAKDYNLYLGPELNAVIDDDKITIRITSIAGEIISCLELGHEELAQIYRKAKYRRKKARKAKRELIF